MKLRIVGGGDDLNNHIPPTVAKAAKFLRALPDGDLYYTDTLAGKIGVTADRIKHFTTHRALSGMRHRVPMHGTTKLIWGNPRTITEARKAVAK